MPTPVAIDIYQGDAVNSFQAVKDSGIVAVLHKATEGHTIVDHKYAIRRHAFLDIGMKWGAYAFFHGNGKAEADFFLSVAEPDEDTVVALDWEDLPGGAPDADSARAFLERIEEKLGRKAVIYSGNVAKEQISGHDAYFGSHRLWLAQYSASWHVQRSWDKPWLWQYGSELTHSRIPGIGGYCDVNTLVDMDEATFLATWTEDTPAPTPSGFTQTGVASWYDDSHNASGTPVDNSIDMTAAHKTLPFGTAVEVTRNDTNASVVVTIQDRGPYEPGRIIDLRPAAARALGMMDAGVVPVTIKQITP